MSVHLCSLRDNDEAHSTSATAAIRQGLYKYNYFQIGESACVHVGFITTRLWNLTAFLCTLVVGHNIRPRVSDFNDIFCCCVNL